MVRVTTHISDTEKAFLEKIVDEGEYLNVSNAIRDGIRCLMRDIAGTKAVKKNTVKQATGEPSLCSPATEADTV